MSEKRGNPDFEMRCICDSTCDNEQPFSGVLLMQQWGNRTEQTFIRMSDQRLKIETSRDDEICGLHLAYIGRVEDTAMRLKKFLEKWESEAAKLERAKVEKKDKLPAFLEKAYGVKSDPLVFIHAAASNQPQSNPECHDETLALRLIGREVLERLRNRDDKFFSNLQKMAKNFSEMQNLIGDFQELTAKGKIICSLRHLVREKLGRLPSRAEIFCEVWSCGYQMDEKQFRDDCKAMGFNGLPAS